MKPEPHVHVGERKDQALAGERRGFLMPARPMFVDPKMPQTVTYLLRGRSIVDRIWDMPSIETHPGLRDVNVRGKCAPENR